MIYSKDFRASGLGQVRYLTAATAAITLAHLFVEMLCYAKLCNQVCSLSLFRWWTLTLLKI